MDANVKNKFPDWLKDNKTKYCLCLSDDIDSLISCIILNKVKDYKIQYFYDFKGIYRNEFLNKKKKRIGIDMDLGNCSDGKGKRCWSNHVTLIKNNNAANLNTICDIGTNNYYKKYAGSTELQILSYYGVNISDLSEEAKMILLAIDSTYLMYYFNQSNCKYWLCDILGMQELFNLIEIHSKEEFIELQKEYNLKEKIIIDDSGYLNTDIDLEGLSKLFGTSFFLPEFRFELEHNFYSKSLNINDYRMQEQELKSKIFSNALTNKNFIKFNFDKYNDYLKNEKEEGKNMESKEEKDVKVKLVTKEDLKQEADILEKRIYNSLSKQLQYIEKKVDMLLQDKNIKDMLKEVKKAGYEVKVDEDEQLKEDIEFLKKHGFIINRTEEK